jgi:hypothetical protein
MHAFQIQISYTVIMECLIAGVNIKGFCEMSTLTLSMVFLAIFWLHVIILSMLRRMENFVA